MRQQNAQCAAPHVACTDERDISLRLHDQLANDDRNECSFI
jgi:hypothetical protein